MFLEQLHRKTASAQLAPVTFSPWPRKYLNKSKKIRAKKSSSNSRTLVSGDLRANFSVTIPFPSPWRRRDAEKNHLLFRHGEFFAHQWLIKLHPVRSVLRGDIYEVNVKFDGKCATLHLLLTIGAIQHAKKKTPTFYDAGFELFIACCGPDGKEQFVKMRGNSEKNAPFSLACFSINNTSRGNMQSKTHIKM